METHHPYRPDLCQTAQPFMASCNSPQWKVEYLIIYNLILSTDKEGPCYFRGLMVLSTHRVCAVLSTTLNQILLHAVAHKTLF